MWGIDCLQGTVQLQAAPESESGTGRVLQDRLNQLHQGLASKEKHRKVMHLMKFAFVMSQPKSRPWDVDHLCCGGAC